MILDAAALSCRKGSKDVVRCGMPGISCDKSLTLAAPWFQQCKVEQRFDRSRLFHLWTVNGLLEAQAQARWGGAEGCHGTQGG